VAFTTKKSWPDNLYSPLKNTPKASKNRRDSKPLTQQHHHSMFLYTETD